MGKSFRKNLAFFRVPFARKPENLVFFCIVFAFFCKTYDFAKKFAKKYKNIRESFLQFYRFTKIREIFCMKSGKLHPAINTCLKGLKGVSDISRDCPCEDDNARFTTEPSEAFF